MAVIDMVMKDTLAVLNLEECFCLTLYSSMDQSGQPNVSVGSDVVFPVDRLTLLEDLEDDDRFPYVACFATFFLSLLSCGLIAIGLVQLYYIGLREAGRANILIGCVFLVPLVCVAAYTSWHCCEVRKKEVHSRSHSTRESGIEMS